MKSTLQTIRKAEAKWMERLFRYNESHFRDVGLPSHNHWHHQRVWYYIRELLENLSKRDITYSMDETEGLIIAAFFHDIAMHQTFDEVHGQWGADLCKDYFNRGSLPAPQCFPQVLKAIERHDDKKYLYLKNHTDKPGIGILLSVADDLDAFGPTGIVRYTEILMLRGMDTDSIPEKVLTNARSRMDHFKKTFTPNRYLVLKHQQRYERLRIFFRDVLDAADQGRANRAIMERIRENLNTISKADKIESLIEPADNQNLIRLKEEIKNEWAAFSREKPRGWPPAT